MARARVGREVQVGGVEPFFTPAAIPVPAGNAQYVTWDRDDIVGQPGNVLVAVDPSVVLQNCVSTPDTEPDPHYIAPSIYYQGAGSQADPFVSLRSYGPVPAPAGNPLDVTDQVRQISARRRVGSTQHRQIGWPRTTVRWPWQR